MESRLQENLKQKHENYIFPFFWQYEDGCQFMEEELEKIYESGAGAVCVESRHHPDYCGKTWWRDMDTIMGFARTHDMKVWVLDDDRFPTGHCNGAFLQGDNPLAVKFLTVHNTDVKGPLTPGYLLIKGILAEDDTLVGVAAFRRKNEQTPDLDRESMVDLTDCVENGWLKWNVPEGLWRILVFYETHHGNGKLDYFNILDSQSVKQLLERVYQPHYDHYGEEFGTVFQGFFSDEPEFSNLPWYDFQARLGKDMQFIPWSEELKSRLKKRWKDAFLKNLAELWYETGEWTPHVRYDYMDETTLQLSQSFSGQIGEWCEAHKVSHIGHIIEDDNSHGRLGCSTGHYFRSLSDMRMAGIDVVLQQVMPEMDQEEHQWVASSRDGEFFHYGLGKMGSSLAHIDPKKQGDSMCEIFGAFGWQEGTGLMKWLADHMLSRGINHFVPHAFSMKPYPDPDCPPHFYAHGNQMQYSHFGHVIRYMNRAAHLLSGGKYPAKTAVLYHADAEWAGEAMLFQKPVRALLEHQLDCDIIPVDLLKEENAYGAYFEKGIHTAGAVYTCLIIPESQYLPKAVAEFLKKHGTEMSVFFAGKRPKRICEALSEEEENKYLEVLNQIPEVSLEELAEKVKQVTVPVVELENPVPFLRTYPYESPDGNWYVFCFNESREKLAEGSLKVWTERKETKVCWYDPMKNVCRPADFCEDGRLETGAEVRLYLEPGCASILVLGETCLEGVNTKKPQKQMEVLTGPWKVYTRDGEEISDGKEEFPDITAWMIAHSFNGWVDYQTAISIPEGKEGRYGLKLEGILDCADILVNGEKQDWMVGTPYEAQIVLKKGENVITISLPSTPVWKDGDPWSALTMLPRMGLTEYPQIWQEESYGA